MRIPEFLAHLAKAKVPGYDSGGRLEATPDGGIEYVGPPELLTVEVLRVLRERREEVLEFLRTPIDRIPKADLALFDYRRTLSDADLNWIDDAVWGNQEKERTP